MIVFHQRPKIGLELSTVGTGSKIFVGQAFRPDSYPVRPESLTYGNPWF